MGRLLHDNQVVRNGPSWEAMWGCNDARGHVRPVGRAPIRAERTVEAPRQNRLGN